MLHPQRPHPDSAALLEIGRVTRPHGVRGELKVQLHWKDSDALFAVDRVLVRSDEGEANWRSITRARRANKFVLLELEGCTSIDHAEGLRGSALLVPRDALPPLEPGEYYLVDLIGMVVEHAGEKLGVVSEVRPYSTVDAVVIEGVDGKRREQPVLDSWVLRVDLKERVIVLASTDGLIE